MCFQVHIMSQSETNPVVVYTSLHKTILYVRKNIEKMEKTQSKFLRDSAWYWNDAKKWDNFDLKKYTYQLWLSAEKFWVQVGCYVVRNDVGKVKSQPVVSSQQWWSTKFELCQWGFMMVDCFCYVYGMFSDVAIGAGWGLLSDLMLCHIIIMLVWTIM